MSNLRLLALLGVISTMFWAGCEPASQQPMPPTAAQLDAPPPPEPAPPAPPSVAGTQPAPAAPAPETAESQVAESEAAEKTKGKEAAKIKISEEVRPLMLKIVRRQRTRLWELKEKPERLDNPNGWQTVTTAADQLDEVAGKVETLAPEDSEVWEDSIARLRKGTAALRKAASAENVNHFKGAIQTTWRSCNNCHSKYAPKAPMNKLEYASTR